MNLAAHRNLLWRQWRERAPMVALLGGAAVAIQIAAVLDGDMDMLFTVLIMQAMALAGPGALLIAMQGAAGARENGTLRVLRALPVRRVTLAAYELAGTLVACVTPVLIAAGCAAAVAIVRVGWFGEGLEGIGALRLDGQNAIQALSLVIAIGSYSAAQVCLWTFCVGGRSATRVHAGAMLMIAMLGWMVLLAVVFTAMYLAGGGDDEILPLVAVSPFGGLTWLVDPDFTKWWPWLTVPPLIAWALTVWGDERTFAIASRRGAVKGPVVRRRFAGPVSAMAWKLWHDAGALVAVVVVFVLVVTALFTLGEDQRMTNLAANYLEMMAGIGYVLAVLLAVSAYAGDLRADSLAFWRSRPIGVGAWFWSRWVTSILLLVAGVHGVGWLLYWMTPYRPHEWTPDPLFFVTLPLHLLTFALTAWMVCVLRHAIYGGLMGLCLSLSVASVSLIEPEAPVLNVSKAHSAFVSRTTPINGALAPFTAGPCSWAYLQLLLPCCAIVAVAAYFAWRSVRSPAALEPTALPWAAE